jgi:allantoin racemase
MAQVTKKYRFLLIQAFRLPGTPDATYRPGDGRGDSRLMNVDNVQRVSNLLEDVDWELHPGPLATYGDWPVETREEFAIVAAGRPAIVREACKSGKYNAVVLLGGGEPGFNESREVARPFGIPVTSCAHSQMHVASMLGNKFSVIDLADVHNMHYYDLVMRHHMSNRCASIRNINYPLPRPPYTGEPTPRSEKEKFLRGETSGMLEASVKEAIAAIEEDGAEVITFGCSGLFWMQPYLQRRLTEIGWEVPVLEGYGCAITLAKTLVDLKLTASGLMFPGERPKKWRRKKVF